MVDESLSLEADAVALLFLAVAVTEQERVAEVYRLGLEWLPSHFIGIVIKNDQFKCQYSGIHPHFGKQKVTKLIHSLHLRLNLC